MTENNAGWTEDLHYYLVNVIEEEVTRICEENKCNESMAYLILQSLSTAKIEQLKGNRK